LSQCLCRYLRDPMPANYCRVLKCTIQFRKIANFRRLLYFYK
jgi:hypothetical protein